MKSYLGAELIERVTGFRFAWDFPSKHLLSSISHATHPGIKNS